MTRKPEIEFAELLCREFLQSQGYSKTLDSLTTEAKEKGYTLPSSESWYSGSEAIGLNELILTYRVNDAAHQTNQDHDNKGSTSILEVIIAALKDRASQRVRQQPLIRMIRASADGKVEIGGTQTIFSTTRDFSRTRRRSNQEDPATEEEGIETHEANVTATAEESAQLPNIFNTHTSLIMAENQHSNRKRASTAHAILSVPSSPPRAIKTSHSPDRHHIKTSNHHRHETHTLSNEHSDEPPLIRRAYKPIDFVERKMDERCSRSGEYWIPMSLRSKMVMRDLRVLKVNVEEQKACVDAINKRSKHASVSDLDHNKTQERLGVKHQKRCGLCQYRFSDVNLDLTVPSKAITDLRQSWANRGSGGDISRKLAHTNLLKAPMCYDTVAVCVFCAQFLQDQDTYRPFVDKQAERIRKEEEARAVMWDDPLRICEEEKQKILAEVEEKQRGRSSISSCFNLLEEY